MSDNTFDYKEMFLTLQKMHVALCDEFEKRFKDHLEQAGKDYDLIKAIARGERTVNVMVRVADEKLRQYAKACQEIGDAMYEMDKLRTQEQSTTNNADLRSSY